MGVKQWIFQRLSNVAVIIFALWLVYFLVSPGEFTHATLIDLFNDRTSQIYLTITLVLAGLNSMLAGWQIVGDYAKKFHLNHNLFVGFGVAVSLAYIVAGLGIIF